jgi:hypothetical protein
MKNLKFRPFAGLKFKLYVTRKGHVINLEKARKSLSK